MNQNDPDESRSAAQIPHTWRPVTPFSPPWDGVPVLVWRAGDSVWISGRKRTPYAGMNHDWYLGSHRFPPTHWRPLPEPPHEDAER